MKSSVKQLLSVVTLITAIFFAHAAQANTVTDLFNTGVNSSGNVLPDLTSPDPHYTIVAGGDGSIASPTLVHPSSPSPPYVAANTTSAWIEAAPETFLGAYDYQTTFTLPAGATNLQISGLVAVDNTLLGVRINGVSVGTYATGTSLTNLTTTVSGAFTGFNAVSFTTPDANLLSGTNTLTFLAGNQLGSATGFRVDSLSGTFTAAVPEPTCLSLLAATSLLLFGRRRI